MRTDGWWRSSLLIGALMGAFACDDAPQAPFVPDMGQGGAGGEGGMGGAGPMCEAHEVPCEDQSILALDLKDNVAEGEVRNTWDEANGWWVTEIDTTGGGFQPSESYVYMAFTEDGLMKGPISDEDAFVEEAWHISARRYVFRLNSGVGGPGCVTAGRTAPNTDFGALEATPEQVTFFEEEYMTDSCEVVPDGSGLPSPGTVLSTYWTYASCVQMTGNVYVIDLGDGRQVKFTVDQYYAAENQQTCNETGAVPMPSNSGQMKIRWAFLNP